MSSLHGSKFLVGMPALVLLAAAGSMKLVRVFFAVMSAGHRLRGARSFVFFSILAVSGAQSFVA